jgi:hypothetical protein
MGLVEEVFTKSVIEFGERDWLVEGHWMA